jgi:hypothetical protein
MCDDHHFLHRSFTEAHSRSCMKYSMNFAVNSRAPSFRASSTYTAAAAATAAEYMLNFCVPKRVPIMRYACAKPNQG